MDGSNPDMPIPGNNRLAVTDADGDGRSDLVVSVASLAQLLRSRGDGTFEHADIGLIPGAQTITAMASATGQGGTRLVSVAYAKLPPSGGHGVATFVARDNGLHDRVDLSDDPGETRVMTLHDVNGDGRPDLILGGADGKIRIYRATNASGGFQSTPESLTHPSEAGAVTALAIGDATPVDTTGSGGAPDGRLDVLAGFSSSNEVYAGSQQPDGTFGAPIEALWPGGEGISSNPAAAVAVDPAGSGQWAMVPQASTLAFAIDATGALTAVPVGCNAISGTALPLSTSSPAVPFGAVVICDNAVQIAVPGRARLAAPKTVAFGSQRVGTTSAMQTVQLTAKDAAEVGISTVVGTVRIDDVRLEGPDAADFTLTATTGECGAVATAQPCRPRVAFSPQSPGSKHATLVIESDAHRASGAPPHSVELTGTATGPVAATDEATLVLGEVPVGETRSATLTVRNTGDAPLVIERFDVSPEGSGWSVAPGSCASPVPADGSCEATVTFAPTAAGEAAATLTVRSDTVGAEPTVALSARAIAPPTDGEMPGGGTPGSDVPGGGTPGAGGPGGTGSAGTGSTDGLLPGGGQPVLSPPGTTTGQPTLALRAPTRATGRRGQRRSLRLVVRNTGSAATGQVTVEVRLPAGVRLLSSRGRVLRPAKNGRVRLRLAAVQAKRTRTLTLRLRIDRRARRGERRLAIRVSTPGARTAQATTRLQIR